MNKAELKSYISETKKLDILNNDAIYEEFINLKNINLLSLNKVDLCDLYIDIIFKSQQKQNSNNCFDNKDDMVHSLGKKALKILEEKKFDIYKEIKIDDLIPSYTVENKEFNAKEYEALLNTPLFEDKNFTSKHIRDFLCAKNLLKHKKDKASDAVKYIIDEISKKIQGIYLDVYLFIFLITEDSEIIKYHPYYLITHSDLILDDDAKKIFLKSVKKYADSSAPYFMFINEEWNLSNLENFYSQNLEDFFIEEFGKTKSEDISNLENHYPFLLAIILGLNSTELSDKIKKEIKSWIYSGKVYASVIENLLKPFSEDIEFLNNVLTEIHKGKIVDDNNFIKDCLLENLINSDTSSEDIVDYFLLYKQNSKNICRGGEFLDKIAYEKKFSVVDSLFRKKKEGKDIVLDKNTFDEEHKQTRMGHYFIGVFVENYFYETILMFVNNEQVPRFDSIDKWLGHFRKYSEYSSVFSISIIASDKVKSLSKQLFLKFIIQHRQSNQNIWWLTRLIYDFEYYNLFSCFALTTSEASKVILDGIEEGEITANIDNLFSSASEIYTENEIKSLEKSYSFLKEKKKLIDNIINSRKELAKKQNHARLETPYEKQRRINKENDIKSFKSSLNKIFESHKEIDIAESNQLEKFSCLYLSFKQTQIRENRKNEYFDCYTEDIIDFIEDKIKKIIYDEKYYKNNCQLFSLKNLVTSDIGSTSYIDIMCFYSLNLQGEKIKIEKINKDWLKYLFVVFFISIRNILIFNGNFHENIFEIINENTRLKLLREYFNALLTKHKLDNIFSDKINNAQMLDFQKLVPLIRNSGFTETENILFMMITLFFSKILDFDWENEKDNYKKIGILTKKIENVITVIITISKMKVYLDKKVDKYLLLKAIDKVDGNIMDDFYTGITSQLTSIDFFKSVDSDIKIAVILTIMLVFKDGNSKWHSDGISEVAFYSASFLRYSLFQNISIEECEKISDYINQDFMDMKKKWGNIVRTLTRKKLYKEKEKNKYTPRLCVEGKSDEKIIKTAWKKLYPNKSMPFYILNDFEGVNGVKKNIEIESYMENTVVGILDFEVSGYNTWEWFKNKERFEIINNEETAGKTTGNKANNIFLILLPLNLLEDSKLISQVYFIDEKNILEPILDGKVPNKIYFNQDTIFSIEHMFFDYFDENQRRDFFSYDYSKRASPLIFKGDKIKFSSDVVPQLNKKCFKNFEILFDRIEYCLNKGSTK